jgi:hypothetical protein
MKIFRFEGFELLNNAAAHLSLMTFPYDDTPYTYIFNRKKNVIVQKLYGKKDVIYTPSIIEVDDIEVEFDANLQSLCTSENNLVHFNTMVHLFKLTNMKQIFCIDYYLRKIDGKIRVCAVPRS